MEALHRYSEAITTFEQITNINSQNDDALIHEGRVLTKLKRYYEALAIFERLLTLQPGRPELWWYKGVQLLNLRRYQDAIVACNKALELNEMFSLEKKAVKSQERPLSRQQLADLYVCKGQALFRLKRYREADAACDQALALNETYAEAWQFKAYANATRGWRGIPTTLSAFSRWLQIKKRERLARKANRT